MTDTLSPLDWLRHWWPIISVLITGLFGWALLWLRTKFMPVEDGHAIRADLSAGLRRIDTLEAKLDDVPTREDLHRIDLGMAELHKSVALIDQGQKAISHQLQLIQGYLVDAAKDATKDARAEARNRSRG